MSSKLATMAILAAVAGMEGPRGLQGPFRDTLQIDDLPEEKVGEPGSMDPLKRKRKKDTKRKTRKGKNKKGYR